ncbi:hypothetical protein GCM10007391_29270 [Alteromonas halophila]|uniref:Uncharacterized protein n=1 Tax=Alteromonas halophila TaxID=516698 RepID=A0A918JPV7_9ALTE|nr:hypothetical protein GCM10007391_29270 [Alteromonas halophila]
MLSGLSLSFVYLHLSATALSKVKVLISVTNGFVYERLRTLYSFVGAQLPDLYRDSFYLKKLSA